MKGRISVVTGGNRGIGLEVCRQLAAAGDTVVLTARDPAKADAAARSLAHAGDVVGHRLDVTDTASAQALARTLGERFGRLDVLVNNAAINYDTWQHGTDVDFDVLRATFDTNLFGPWQTTVALLSLLRASAHGRIVNVSSESGSLASMGGGTPAYSTSKAALNAFTRVLAGELRHERILVNAVCPGWIATDMGGPGGGPVDQGAASVLWAVDLPDGGPTGGFFRHGRPLAW